MAALIWETGGRTMMMNQSLGKRYFSSSWNKIGDTEFEMFIFFSFHVSLFLVVSLQDPFIYLMQVTLVDCVGSSLLSGKHSCKKLMST